MKELLDCFAPVTTDEIKAVKENTNICASASECMCKCHGYGAVGCTDCLDRVNVACVKPLVHRPRMAGVLHCKQCEREVNER